MPFPLEVPLSHILNIELLEGGASYSSLNRILAWPEGGMSQVLRVYFFGTKRTFNLDKRASFHNGEFGGVFVTPGPHFPYLNPCMSTLYSA